MISYKDLIILTVLLDIIIYYNGLTEAHPAIPDDHSKNEPLSEDVYYTIVIDAGSTGSRALAVNFKKTPSGSFELGNELIKKINPGLCSFADNPQKGAELIDQLISEVKSIVPVDYQNRTPIVLRATAGLRSLSTEKANGLINKVIQLFDGYPFFKYNNSVAILDGVHEGIFSWFTVNFLLGRLNGKKDRTVAALDLGGGSLQITFIPTDINQVIKESPTFVIEHTIMNEDVKLYSHSYSDVGFVTARKSVVVANGDSSHLTNPCVKVMDEEIPLKCTQNISCSCETVESSKHSPAVDYLLCKSTIEAFVKTVNTDKPKDLTKQTIVAFSHIYVTAKHAGLVNEKGGNVTIKSFYEAAEKECSRTNYNELHKNLCFDLTYISVFMEKGFGLPVETSVTLFKTINGHEISWALGAAYHTVENGIETDII